MVTVPLAKQAYKRDFAGAADIRLENRFAEAAPTNMREGVALIGRPGTNSLASLAGGGNRGNYTKLGMFGGDLFVVNGQNLWRVNKTTGAATQITGTIANFGNPYVAWMNGIGYQYMFISDGNTVQYFSEHAAGVLTLGAGNHITAGLIIDINGKYFGWSGTVDAGAPAGTSANPYLAKLATDGVDPAANDAQSLANMVLLLNGSGIPGADYSSTAPGPNADVTATSTETTLVVTAIDGTTAGNAITTSVFAGAAASWGGATLTGGGGTVLRPVTGMGANESARACAGVSGYVLVSVGNSEKFYWINPGEVTIDPLNFASKESNPDNILDMLTVGDQVLICGDGSAENWYASGDITTPFVPQEGRVYRRGVIEGTPVVVNDSVILVGNNGRVYSVGASGGEAQWGVKRISTHAIEERIRVRLRFEQGLPP